MGKALVVGFGSIGRRHASILKKMGMTVNIFSRRKLSDEKNFPNLKSAIYESNPEYLVIANETSEHYSTLKNALSFKIPKILVEKPLFSRIENDLDTGQSIVRVAYNLRFHPLMSRISSEIVDQSIISVHVYVGQYLPSWRKEKNYLNSYSISSKLGGGVLRDLSHELDYLNWLFGPWLALTSKGGHFSSLEGDSEDVFSILLKMKNCPVISLQMNYLDKKGRREIIVNTDRDTFFLDLVEQKIIKNNNPADSILADKDQTYIAQHKDMIENQGELCCSLLEGIEIMQMIHLVEKSNHKQIWIEK